MSQKANFKRSIKWTHEPKTLFPVFVRLPSLSFSTNFQIICRISTTTSLVSYCCVFSSFWGLDYPLFYPSKLSHFTKWKALLY